MTLVVVRKPTNPDRRGFWGRLLGERWHPAFSSSEREAVDILHAARRQNDTFSAQWRGRIGRIVLK
jgi:hypothetical protein